MFKIHHLLVVKDEADVIQEHLDYMAELVDSIWVMDNGSTDGTLEIVKNHKKVNTCFRKPCVFHCGMREEFTLGLAYLGLIDKEDWFVHLAADHFPERNLRELIYECEENGFNVLDGDQCQFYYTDEDFYYRDTEDLSASIMDRRRYYSTIFNFRAATKADSSFKWGGEDQDYWHVDNPKINPNRVLVRHYSFRDPVQIQKRLDARKLAQMRGTGSFTHYGKHWDWRDYVALSEKLEYWKSGRIQTQEDTNYEKVPGMWKKGMLKYKGGVRIEEVTRWHHMKGIPDEVSV